MSEFAKSICDNALSKGNVQYECASYKDACLLRNRCYNLRTMMQRKSRKIFDSSEPGYGSSPYDNLTFSVVGKNLFIGSLGEVKEIINVSDSKV